MDKKPYRNRKRRKYECPLKLKILLEKMNWINQSGEKLWVFNDALTLIKTEKPNIDDYEALQEAFRICLANFPVEMQNYVNYGVPKLTTDDLEIIKLSPSDILTDINNRILRYEDFRLSSEKLFRLVHLYQTSRKRGWGADFSVRAINEDFGGTGILQIDENGIVHIINDSFGEAINGVILDRLRRCEICERVFWAENKNSKTCSPNHAANLRNRQSRMRNKELREESKDLVNEKRRLTNKRKKEQRQGKERKEKRNGSL